MLNVEQARFNMIEQQVRPWDVLDPTVLDLMHEVPREAFVPEAYRDLAYADIEVPLGHGEAMLPPRVVGRLMQAVGLDGSDSVLEVGTGSGYMTALLAKCCREVCSVDIHADFTNSAKSKLAALDITNATLETGDASKGWDAHRPYDVIILTGSAPTLPDVFKKSLNRGGRLAAIVGTGPVMEAILITRVSDNEWSQESLFETELRALSNMPQVKEFKF